MKIDKWVSNEENVKSKEAGEFKSCKGSIFGMDRLFCWVTKQDKKVKLIVMVGVIGILIMLIGNMNKQSEVEQVSNLNVEEDSAKYVSDLENKVLELIKSIEGVGQAKVMITLESGVENVYAGEEKKNTDTTENIDTTDQSKKIQQKNQYEQKLILIEGKSGGREALIKTQLEPIVKGVVVVCEGGGNSEVEERIMGAITTALNVSYNKVWVTKLS